MADLSITISETLVVLGGSPPSLYGTAVFGTDYWGASEDYELQIGKWLSETITLTETLSKAATTTRTETITVTGNNNLEALRDSEGYCYIQAGVCDPDDRNLPSYTTESGSEPTYTEVSGSSPTWGES